MSVATTRDVYEYGLAMLGAALDATTEADAPLDAQAVVADLPVDVVRRVATLLAVETVWHSRPRRSRRALREWVELRRFQAMTAALPGERGS